MTDGTRRYVLVFYVGGPWDGRTEPKEVYPDSPTSFLNRVLVPVPERVSAVTTSLFVMPTTPRHGEYEYKGEQYEMITVDEFALSQMNVPKDTALRHMLRYTRPVALLWRQQLTLHK